MTFEELTNRATGSFGFKRESWGDCITREGFFVTRDRHNSSMITHIELKSFCPVLPNHEILSWISRNFSFARLA